MLSLEEMSWPLEGQHEKGPYRDDESCLQSLGMQPLGTGSSALHTNVLLFLLSGGRTLTEGGSSPC